MKNLLVLSISLIFLSSCSNGVVVEPPPFRDAPTQFIITDIMPREGMKKMTTYYVEVVDVNDLVHDNAQTNRNLSFWFCDSIDKYKLGQPIHFDKTR